MPSPRSTRSLLRPILVAIVMLVAFAYPSAASADTLYAASGAGGNLANLYTLNPSTGAVVTGPVPITIDSVQVSHVTGLAVDPTDGTMYGFANGDFCCDPGTFDDGTLMTINKTTGAATVVGTMGGVQLRASDMTFDRFGTLYAWQAGCGGDDNCDSNGSDLYTLDTTNGTATQVSESGTEGFRTGLASDSMGRMYLKSDVALFRVNPFSGHVFSPVALICCNTQNLLTFGPSDVLYTGNRTGSGLQLQTMNTTSGAVTSVGAPNGAQNISAIEWDFTTPTEPDVADLSLDVGVSNATPTANTNVTFTLTLVNGNADSATGVMVKDLLPSGFTYVSHVAGTGTYSNVTGIWNVGTLGPANGVTLDIVATVLPTGVHTNAAEVVETTTYDTDSTPGSGEGDTFDSARSAPSGATALYAASGAGSGFCGGSPSSLYELDPSTGAASKVASITIGGNQVTHVTGLAVHPSTGTLYGFMGFQGSDCDLSGGGSNGTLITINKTTGAGTVVGSTGIGSPDMTFDPFGTLYAWGEGNAAQTESDDLYTLDTTTGASTMVGECSCGTSSTGLASDSSGRLWLKASSSFLIRMNPFTGVRVAPQFALTQSTHNMLAFGPNDVLFSGRRDEPSDFSFMLKTIDLSNGDPAATTDVGTNSVYKIAALTWDLGTITPPNVADLSLDKTVNNASPSDWFENVTFTITVSNAGPDDATDVEVQDLLESGFSYVSDNPSAGTYNSSTGIWNVGTIADTDSETLEIVASVQPSGSHLNVAEVFGTSSYDTNSVPRGGVGQDTFDSLTVTPDADPAIDAAADVVVSGPSKANATSKGFTVLIRNAGIANFTVTNANLETSLNGNESATSCKAFSATVKPGRSVRAHCSANIATLGLTPPQTVTYSATVDVPTDGFTSNDEDSEVRATS